MSSIKYTTGEQNRINEMQKQVDDVIKEMKIYSNCRGSSDINCGRLAVLEPALSHYRRRLGDFKRDIADKKEKQEKILSQQQETESFFELDTVIPVNTVNTVNIVDTIDTKDSMDNLHTVNTIDTKIDTVIPIGLGGLVITGIIAYLVFKK